MNSLQPEAEAGGGVVDDDGSGLRVTWVRDQICANVLRIGQNVVMQRGGFCVVGR